MHRLLDWRDRVCVTLMAADLRSTPREWLEAPDSVIRSLPLDRGNMAACFQDCDVVLDASFHEGFGLVPLEAMACGAAIVCSDSGGVGQFVRHEVNGLLVPEVNKPERWWTIGSCCDVFSRGLYRPRTSLPRPDASMATSGFSGTGPLALPRARKRPVPATRKLIHSLWLRRKNTPSSSARWCCGRSDPIRICCCRTSS